MQGDQIPSSSLKRQLPLLSSTWKPVSRLKISLVTKTCRQSTAQELSTPLRPLLMATWEVCHARGSPQPLTQPGAETPVHHLPSARWQLGDRPGGRWGNPRTCTKPAAASTTRGPAGGSCRRQRRCRGRPGGKSRGGLHGASRQRSGGTGREGRGCPEGLGSGGGTPEPEG